MLRHAAIASTLYEVRPRYPLWVHLVAEVGRRGNPRFYDTFLSEAHTPPLKNVRRALHQLRLSGEAWRECARSWRGRRRRKSGLVGDRNGEVA